MNFPQKSKKTIIAAIPDSLIKERQGAKNTKLSYLSGSTVVDILNQAFDYMWSWEATQEWIQESVPKFNPKYDAEPVAQGPVAHVKGTLTVHMFDGNGAQYFITKTGYGSKAVLGSQTDQESVFKAAGTDALKKAASLFGIGLQLYRDEEEQEYFDMLNYEDPWTEAMLKEYEEEREFIGTFIADNDLSDEAVSAYFEDFSDGEFDSAEGLTPENIREFAQYLQSLEVAEA